MVKAWGHYQCLGQMVETTLRYPDLVFSSFPIVTQAKKGAHGQLFSIPISVVTMSCCLFLCLAVGLGCQEQQSSSSLNLCVSKNTFLIQPLSLETYSSIFSKLKKEK